MRRFNHYNNSNNGKIQVCQFLSDIEFLSAQAFQMVFWPYYIL